MQRQQAPPQLQQHLQQQQYKRQASFGVGDNAIEQQRSNDPLNSPYINTNSTNPHYYASELQTVGMRIRQRVDQGYSLLLNREKSDLSNASLNPQDYNVKNYAGLIVPQFNPVSPPLDNNNNQTFQQNIPESASTLPQNNIDTDINMDTPVQESIDSTDSNRKRKC